MASELTVQTLRGPTSGANANKVLIPSGQTLDASNGFIAPAGHVVQHQFFNAPYGGASNESETSSSSFVATLYQVAITPKFSNSRMLVFGNISSKENGINYHQLALYRSIGGSSFSNVFTDAAIARNSNRTSLAYPQQGFHVPDQPNTTQEVIYKIYHRTSGGGHVSRLGDNSVTEFLHVMEIKL